MTAHHRLLSKDRLRCACGWSAPWPALDRWGEIWDAHIQAVERAMTAMTIPEHRWYGDKTPAGRALCKSALSQGAPARDDTPWPLTDVLHRLVAFARHCLDDHCCDQQGYEGVGDAIAAALRYAGAVTPALDMLLETRYVPYGPGIGCAECPFATASAGRVEPNPADPDEGYYDCSLLSKLEIWGEDPICAAIDWKARAQQEIERIQCSLPTAAREAGTAPSEAPAGAVTPGSGVVPPAPVAYRHVNRMHPSGGYPTCSCGWRGHRWFANSYHTRYAWLEHAVAAYQQEEAAEQERSRANHDALLAINSTFVYDDDEADCDALAGDDVAGSEVRE